VSVGSFDGLIVTVCGLVGGSAFDVNGFSILWIFIYDICIVITVAMVMLRGDFGPYWIVFMLLCFYCFKILPSFFDG
jgi:hypothetical protein